MDGMRFCSPSVKWQEHLCERFSVDHKLTPNLYSNERKFLGPPVSIHRITGDGNCLFRSFAYVISGNEDGHRTNFDQKSSIEPSAQVSYKG